MKIGIHSRGFPLTSAIAGYLRKRLGFLVRGGFKRLQRVDVTLSDINGQRGGVDKRCQIKVSVDGMRSVVIRDVQSDLYKAIDIAADRARRTVVRRLSLVTSKRRTEARRWMDRHGKRNPQSLVTT